MNNRLIKFRAYHPEYGFFYSDSENPIYEKREFYPFCFSVGFSHYREYDWELSQWTGLTDKDGNEIYEGDIVSFIDKSCLANNKNPDKFITKVVWDNNYGHWMFQELDCDNEYDGWYWYELTEVKIIGDIYETKTESE